MHRLLAKTPFWLRWLFPRYTWRMPGKENVVYLTFDDGPHPEITPFVLDELSRYGAKATFFCIGKNVALYPEVFHRILAEGHTVGNHTQHHLNGWKTDTETYLEGVAAAQAFIQSKLFRPPYGRIRNDQAKGVVAVLGPGAQIIMWDVLSADFDQGLKPEQVLRRVVNNVEAGSIIVFHDSEKAYVNLRFALPSVLSRLQGKGFRFEAIKEEIIK